MSDSPSSSSSALARIRQRRANTNGSSTVTETSTSRSGSAAGITKFYSEDTPGLKVDPIVVLVLSLIFIASVFVLHIWGMPLYELFVISKSINQVTRDGLANLMKNTANSVMNTQAVIRNIEYLGTQKLPYRMKHQESYAYEGSYWLMNLFASPAILEQIRGSLKLQSDVIRFTILKKADTLKHLIRP